MNDAPAPTRRPLATEASLRAAFDAFLQGIPEQTLRRFLTTRALCAKGVRPNAPKRALVALAAQTFAPRLRTRDGTLAALLGDCGHPLARLTALLEPAALRACAPALAVRFGADDLFLALFQDARDDVRALAQTLWDGADADDLPDPGRAQTALADLFGPLMGAADAPPPPNHARLAELRAQNETLEKTLRKERREAAEAAQRAEREKNAACKQLQFHIDERDRVLAALEAKAAKAEREREERLRAEVASRLITAFHGWLAPAIRAERLAQADPAAPILERVGAALAEQARLDRASASRARLRARLGDVEAALCRVDDALAGAQIRSAALLAVRDDLIALRETLRETLRAEGLPPGASLLAAQLRSVIQASRQKQQPALEDLLRLAFRFRLIDAPEEAALRETLRRRQALWGIEVPADPAAPEPDPTDPAAVIAQRNPDLARGLRGAAPLYLFLDGHNILNGISRYRTPRGEPMPHEAARKLLEGDVRALLQDRPLVYAQLVWDGATRSSYSLAENVTVHYSGGTGEHRADHYILDQIEYARGQGQGPLVLVSDDNGFRGQAQRLGAACCRLHDFAAFLTNALH